MEYGGKYQNANRFSNLDGVEAKVITHLINSTSHYAEDIWRLLKYADETALSKPSLTEAEKKALVFVGNNGDPDATKKARVFLEPLAPYTARLLFSRVSSGTQTAFFSIRPRMMPL